MKYALYISICFAFSYGSLGYGQVAKNSSVFMELKAKDSLLFQLGYNQVDTAQVAALTGEDFEFYHDKGGITNSKGAMVTSMGSLGSMSYKATRELKEGSLEVYPLKNKAVLYAAIQTGEHQFWADYEGKEKFVSSTAKFVTLWTLEEGDWKMKRVLSFDHQVPNESDPHIEMTKELAIQLKEKDQQLFNAAFNTCSPDVLEALFTEDFEFYHDKGGLTKGRNAFLDPMRSECAKRDMQQPQPSKRILVPNSLTVYPLFENGALYGAIQMGVHKFASLNAEGNYVDGDIAKFLHLWLKIDGEWKIKRELSYDHQLQQ